MDEAIGRIYKLLIDPGNKWFHTIIASPYVSGNTWKGAPRAVRLPASLGCEIRNTRIVPLPPTDSMVCSRVHLSGPQPDIIGLAGKE